MFINIKSLASVVPRNSLPAKSQKSHSHKKRGVGAHSHKRTRGWGDGRSFFGQGVADGLSFFGVGDGVGGGDTQKSVPDRGEYSSTRIP